MKCCIAGGGPAGIMTGCLLARAGIRVTVLEKHQDFFRDFRGDTVHPSTLEVMHELGILDGLLHLPHQNVTRARVLFGGKMFEFANLDGVKARCPYIAFMPQWDFLNFLSEQAGKFPSFELRMQHEVADLLREGDRIRGVVARTPAGAENIEADLVIGCDGRHSAVRAAAKLEVIEKGVPIDVLWFRIRRNREDPWHQVMGVIDYGRALVLLDRGDYFQAGLIVPKGALPQIQNEGLEKFRALIARMAPLLEKRVEELTDWDQIKLLTVQINRLRRWHRPGLLCIGDAAHAMSPAFGVGINLAIQDAVATANLLIPALKNGGSPDALPLEQVQRRREFPTRVTQALQVIAHTGLKYVFAHHGPMRPPLGIKLVTRIPGIQRAVGRVVGIGVRPEHVLP